MGNNSSGSAVRGSRDNLNENDGEAKGSNRKRSVDDAKGSSRSAAQPPDNDEEAAYDLPYEQPSKDAVSLKGDVTASSSSGPRKGSVPSTAAFASAAAIAVSAAAAAKAAGQRKGSDADQSGRGSGEPAAVEHRRNFFKKSKKKSGDSGTKSHDRSASQSDSTVDDGAGAVDSAAALQITSSAGGKVKLPTTRPDLARLGSKEESSASSSAATPPSRSGAGASAAAISNRMPIPPAPLSPPPRLPVMRSTSTDGSVSTALTSAIASTGTTSSRSEGTQIDGDDNNSDDTYDRIQRDARPSKVKAAASRQRGGSGEFDVAVPDRERSDSTAYEEVHPVAPLQRQPPPVALSVASIVASRSDSVAVQQMGRPPPLVPHVLNEKNDDEDSEGSYDVIQRDVNPVKAKQKLLQQQHQPTGQSSIVNREDDGRSVKRDDEDDDGADTYDVIQRDVNPLKAKQQQQQLQRAQSAGGHVADGGDTRAKPRRAATLDAYTDYSLPHASTVEPTARAGDGRGGMAETTRTVAAPPRSQHQRSNNGSGEPVPAAAIDGGGDDDGGEYECIRENFVTNISSPSAKDARKQWMEGVDSSGAGYMAIDVTGSSGSAQQGASSATSNATVMTVTGASPAAKATSHGDDARTRVTASVAVPNSATAPARTLYSEVRAVAQRPGAAAGAAVPSAAATASATRLPPLPPAKQFLTSTEDDAYCSIAPCHNAGEPSRIPDGGRPSAADLEQTTATTVSEASGEQRKLRANVMPHSYENVEVSLPSPQLHQLGSRDAPPTDSEANFESSSAFYANDQSLRGSPQPPALTASPPLPRSGGVRSRDAEAQRPRPAATAHCTGSPLQPMTPASPCKPQLKAKPVGSPLGADIDFAVSTSAGHPALQQPLLKAKPVGGLLYAEIDLAVGTPAGHSVQQHQHQHPDQHPHSTQDGLFQYGSTSTVGSPAPSIPLSPPRQRPWVPRREPRYEDVDDVRSGAA